MAPSRCECGRFVSQFSITISASQNQASKTSGHRVSAAGGITLITILFGFLCKLESTGISVPSSPTLGLYSRSNSPQRLLNPVTSPIVTYYMDASETDSSITLFPCERKGTDREARGKEGVELPTPASFSHLQNRS